MFDFKNKTILIISPQKWGKMHISKHHYALELAKKGNIVYFLNPPVRQFLPKIRVSKNEKFDNLFIIDYSFFFPYNLRFHFRTLFDKLLYKNITFILKKIKQKIDVVWCFDTNLLSGFHAFKNTVKIYHPVDNISGTNQKGLLESADFVFSLSEVITKDLQTYHNQKIYFINHGLSDYFIKHKQKSTRKNIKKSAYFVGNVLLASLDRIITKKIITENHNITFTFIGAYDYSSNNISGSSDADALKFVEFLKKSDNVILKGMIHPKNIPEELQNADILLVLIDPQKDINKGSNSHKILEYLSTGKVIVANHISTYADKPGLIEMVDEMHNDKLPALFKKVINNLDYYNSPELQKKRIEFALNNTYAKQIERIEKIISENLRIK